MNEYDHDRLPVLEYVAGVAYFLTSIIVIAYVGAAAPFL